MVRTHLLREIARAVVPGGDVKEQRERYILGASEQRAVAAVLEAVDRERERLRG